MKLRVREWIHPDHALSKNDIEAWRIYNSKRVRNGLPALCYGLYKVAALQGCQMARLVLRSGTQRGRTPWNRARPEWCSEKTWDSWMAYRRRYNDSVTLADWMAKRFGVRIGKVRHNFSTLQRSPAEIAAKINAMATRWPPGRGKSGW